MTRVPKNTTRKPTSKKTFSISDYKKKNNAVDVADKPLEWIVLSPALQQATGLLGYPKGYVSLSRGFSNTGKSTAILEAAVSAQKMGILPIIIDTENNIARDRLSLMGFDWDNDFYIYIDNDFLLKEFGRKKDKKKTIASIEDMADCINYFLNQQENGDLPVDLIFIIDSIGTLDCDRSINAHDKGTSDNNMWNAGAYERAFKGIINSRIPSSRKINKTYTNTLVGVQKIWLDSMAGGAPTVKHKGGEAFYFASRLIYHHGGIMTHGTKKISSTSKHKEVLWGVETKIKVEKNHIDGPLGGIGLEGKLISTPHGFIGIEKEDKDKYKKEHILYFREKLEDTNLNVEDIKLNYSQDNTEVSFDVDEFNKEMGENIGND